MQSSLTRGNRNRLQHRKCCLDVKGKVEKDVTASIVQPWDRGLEKSSPLEILDKLPEQPDFEACPALSRSGLGPSKSTFFYYSLILSL